MNTSHQDASRSKVGTTAYMVAFARHQESSRGASALIFDPYAGALSSTLKDEDLEGILRVPTTVTDGATENPFKPSQMIRNSPEYDDRIIGMAVRTRKIDDEILKSLRNDSITQVIVLGAGLDTRPWRLSLTSHVLSEDDVAALNGIDWFELDFPEIFEFKLPILASNGAKTLTNYRHVEADLSLPSWIDKLVASGYDSSKKSLWLLEGLTGYLTEDENKLLFSTIFDKMLSGSKVLATFLTPKLNVMITLHRFHPNNPLIFVEQFGFKGIQEEFSPTIIEQYGKIPGDMWRGYFLVSVGKP